jgi:hypothetical protein
MAISRLRALANLLAPAAGGLLTVTETAEAPALLAESHSA